MLRQLLLWLSRQAWGRRLLLGNPLTRGMAWRFVAGEDRATALAAVRELNARGIRATLDYLGENVATREEATAAADEAIAELRAIAEAGVEANISIKLTQLGLDLGDDFCAAQLARVLACAREHGNFVRVDMEGSAYTARTLAIVRAARREYNADTVGTVIQSSLRRSQDDVAALIAEGSRVRLVKGAYDEPATIAFPAKADTDRAYRIEMEMLLARGHYPRHRDPRRAIDRAGAGLRRRRGDRRVALRVSDALRRPARTARAPGERGLQRPLLRPVWHAVVSLLHAPSGRAPGEYPVYRQEFSEVGGVDEVGERWWRGVAGGQRPSRTIHRLQTPSYLLRLLAHSPYSPRDTFSRLPAYLMASEWSARGACAMPEFPQHYSTPSQPQSGYQPPFFADVQEQAYLPAPRPAKEPSTGLLLELLGLVGFAGIGWLWAGRTGVGLLMLFGFWAFLAVEIVLLFVLVGFCLIPFNFVIPVASALLIQKYLREQPRVSPATYTQHPF